ncbi:MAG: hypothetical protein JRD89_01295 [Deltaproteobacteria bacterium]|nr:hypothetical protein [Deltaproteobacteria bacterium]
MKDMRLTATIRISPSTRKALRLLGKKGETYDQIISRLIEVAASAMAAEAMKEAGWEKKGEA